MAEVTLRMAMRRTHMVWVGVGEMAGAIVPASTFTMRGKDITAAAAIIRSSTMVAAARHVAAASTLSGGGHGGGGQAVTVGGGGGHR